AGFHGRSVRTDISFQAFERPISLHAGTGACGRPAALVGERQVPTHDVGNRMMAMDGPPSAPAKSSNRRVPAILRRKLRVAVLPFFTVDESKDGALASAAAEAVASALREVQCIEVVSEESFLYDSSEYHAGTERAQSDLVEYAVEGA